MDYNSLEKYLVDSKRLAATRLGFPAEHDIASFNFDRQAVDSLLYGVEVNSYNRFGAFLKYCSFLSFTDSELYSYALSMAYTSSDNLFAYGDDVRTAFEAADNLALMNEDDIRLYQSLPDMITIYRGMTVAERDSISYGLSWTLKKEVAEFFAYKYNRNHTTNHLPKCVHEITITKADITCVFTDRDESEIICLF
ncbi:hypothetical protein JYG30_17015 [Fibrella sp. USSR17]